VLHTSLNQASEKTQRTLQEHFDSIQ
jgi:hypothetical protein